MGTASRRATVALLGFVVALLGPVAPARGGPPAPAGPARGTVSGLVTDEEGKPLAGATARVITKEGKEAGKATSDAKGFYAVRSLAPGTATVVVRARGRIPVQQEVKVPATGIAVADAKLLPGVRFAGKVVNVRSEPVGDARIVAFESRGDDDGGFVFRGIGAGDQTRSAADGSFELDGLAPGSKYTLRLVHPRYRPLDLPGLDASAGGGHDHLEAIFEDGAWITGTVLDAAGRPVAGAEVSGPDDPFTEAMSVGGMFRILMHLFGDSAVPPTDAAGRFLVGSLVDEQAVLTARADGYFPGQATVEKLEPGKERSGVVIRLEPATATVEGVVVDTTGAPVPKADVTAGNEEDGHVARGTTDAQGRFRLTRVATRSAVDLEACADGYQDGQATGVALGSKDARIEVKKLGRLRVKVVGPDGKPVARVTVSTLVGEGGEGHGGQQQMDQGAAGLEVLLPLGEVEVEVEAEGLESGKAGQFHVEPGQSFDAGTVTLAKKGG